MKIKLQHAIESFRASYLVVPLILSLLGILLSFGVIALDDVVSDEKLSGLTWIYTGGPEGARTLLSTVAGSVITVAGVAYSITIAALALASTQFGPRLLRNFIDDTGNQVVLGTFVATCLYCLLVLRTVRSENEGGVFVPNIAVTVGVLLAVLCLILLVYFINHVAASIQAPHVIANVSRDLHQSIDRLFPQGVGRGRPQDRPFNPDEALPANFHTLSRAIEGRENGYVQVIDMDTLLEEAIRRDCIISLGFRPGDFAQQEAPLVRVYPPERVDERLIATVRAAFITGDHRTPFQDLEFGINQLVEVGTRALSAAINDPFTAMSCLDHLGSALTHLLKKELPSPYRFDEQDQLRLIAERISFRGIIDASFNLFRQYGRDSAALTIRLLETIALVAPHAHDPEAREALLRQATMTRRDCLAVLPEEFDREDVEERYQAVLKALESQPAS